MTGNRAGRDFQTDEALSNVFVKALWTLQNADTYAVRAFVLSIDSLVKAKVDDVVVGDSGVSAVP